VERSENEGQEDVTRLEDVGEADLFFSGDARQGQKIQQVKPCLPAPSVT